MPRTFFRTTSHTRTASIALLCTGMAFPMTTLADPTDPKPAAPGQTPPGMPTPGMPTPRPTGLPQNPAQAQPKALKFANEKAAFDWGDISDTAPVEHDVEFTNTTDETITFAIAASCGCTVAQPEKNTLAAGESTKAKAKFDPHGKSGAQTKTLTFTVTNPQGKYAQQTYNLSSNIKALITIEPPKVFVNEVDHRKGKKEKITIKGRKEGFKVEKVESANDKIVATIGEPKVIELNGEKLTEYAIELEIGKGAPIGNLNTQLTITTNDEKAKVNPIYVGADVVGDIKCTPAQAILRVNTLSTPFSTDLRLDSRSGTEFSITGIDIENTKKEMNVVADVKPGPNNAYFLITLSGLTPKDPGMHTGYLVITTDAGGGETLRVPFSAAVTKPINQPAMNPNNPGQPGQPPMGQAPARPGTTPAAPGSTPTGTTPMPAPAPAPAPAPMPR